VLSGRAPLAGSYLTDLFAAHTPPALHDCQLELAE
jgi:hypothetical protein